ncbi:MAG: tetratricopeptide repeat protein [Vitreimonas sp.]
MGESTARSAICAMLLALISQSAWAQTNAGGSPPPTGAAEAPVAFEPTVCEHPVDGAQEAADQRIVDEAMSATNSGGYPALATRLAALREVISRAPSCYPEVERRGDDIIVRSNLNSSAILALTLVAVSQHQNVRVLRGSNPYGNASLLLGAYSDEEHRFEEGISWLDRGLALQPREENLVLEKATALGQLRRIDEQVALLQSELDDPFASLSIDQSRYQRNLGVALIDANRLDEAEAALRESIRLEPNNPRAQNELRHIAQLRAGGQRADTTMAHIGDTPANPRR